MSNIHIIIYWPLTLTTQPSTSKLCDNPDLSHYIYIHVYTVVFHSNFSQYIMLPAPYMYKVKTVDQGLNANRGCL